MGLHPAQKMKIRGVMQPDLAGWTEHPKQLPASQLSSSFFTLVAITSLGPVTVDNHSECALSLP